MNVGFSPPSPAQGIYPASTSHQTFGRKCSLGGGSELRQHSGPQRAWGVSESWLLPFLALGAGAGSSGSLTSRDQHTPSMPRAQPVGFGPALTLALSHCLERR